MQAPEIPNQKRKRGAAAGSQARAQDASQLAPRSRRTDKEAETPAGEQRADKDAVTQPEKHGKRGRPRKGETKVPEEKADDATGAVRRSKRDRRSTDDTPCWISGVGNAEEEEQEAGDITAPPLKRARLSSGAVSAGPKKQGAPSRHKEKPVGQTQTAKHLKGRPAPVEQPKHADPEPKRRGRPRISDASAAGREEPIGEVESEPKRRGRPRKSDVSTVQGEQPVGEESEFKQRGRPRLSDVPPAGPPARKGHSTKPTEAQSRLPKKPVIDGGRVPTASQRRVSKNAVSQEANRLVAEMDDEVHASLPPVPKFRQLEPKIRQIPMSAVNTKWSKLDEATIEAISTIISDTSVSVLQRLRDNPRCYEPGHAVLRAFAGKLRNKLRKGQPFPPASTQPPGTKSAAGKSGASDGRREELSFESTVDSIDSMETMLNPLLHSVALLEKEKAKEEVALEKEYETLRTLEANAKAEAAGWRERMRKAHPLAPDPRKQDDAPELDRASGEKLSLVKHESTPLVGVFSDANDEALLSLSKQVASHISSIQKNMQPVQDVLPAIAKSRAALQGALQTHLAPQQFERVLLG